MAIALQSALPSLLQWPPRPRLPSLRFSVGGSRQHPHCGRCTSSQQHRIPPANQLESAASTPGFTGPARTKVGSGERPSPTPALARRKSIWEKDSRISSTNRLLPTTNFLEYQQKRTWRRSRRRTEGCRRSTIPTRRRSLSRLPRRSSFSCGRPTTW